MLIPSMLAPGIVVRVEMGVPVVVVELMVVVAKVSLDSTASTFKTFGIEGTETYRFILKAGAKRWCNCCPMSAWISND